MGLFDIFKKDKPNNTTTENGILGPTFLDGLTNHILNPKDLQLNEWRRQLKSTKGQTKFKVKYYGKLHENHPSLIIGTDFAPALIFALDISSEQEILLFDGCKHGYDPMFCNTYTEEQINNRVADNLYVDKDGKDIFEITISTYNNFDFDKEMKDEVDENGLLELDNGSKVEFEVAKRNGFDTLQIWVTNNERKVFNIISEELA